MMDNDLTILHWSHVPVCDAVVDKHFDGYCSLQYVVDSRLELSYDDEQYELEGDWFFACWPGPRIRFRALDTPPRWEHRHLAFRGPREAAWQAAGLLPRRPLRAVGDYRARVDGILRDAARHDVWGPRRAMNALESLLLDLAAPATDPTPPAWLRTVTASLEAYPEAPPDYEALAASVGMGLSTLRRRFREATGDTLHERYLATRLAAARELLLQTDLPVREIAERLGYQDVYFFTRQFSQRVGTPPGRFRRTRI